MNTEGINEKSRFVVWDVARAIAFFRMMVIHFGEGALQRLPRMVAEWVGVPLLFLGRFLRCGLL
ncbi:MAG: hypothetical protein N2035_09375 [Chthoniobacterales bacterium]|nr:hypothetical protein [Chthoniobacterales bacterium]